MHVGLLAPEFLPNWGGVGTYCIELARALRGEVELDVITLKRELYGQPSMTASDMEAYLGGRLKVHTIAQAKDTFLYNATFQIAVERYLTRHAKEDGLDLVHSQHANMCHLLYATFAKELPILATLHTTIRGQRLGIEESHTAFERLEPSEKWQVLLQPALRIAEQVALRAADRLVTMSKWMLQTLRTGMPDLRAPIDVIPNGVDTTRYAPERARECELLDGFEGPVVLISSRPTAAKGIQFAIDAIPRILAENREVRFVFAGGGNMDVWRRSLADRGIPEHAFVSLGYVPYEKLPSLYARATVYLLPTLYENVPLRMLEAMSCGVPVIATRVAGIPEVITDGKDGLLIPPRDAGAIAANVLRLLDDEAFARGLGRAARETMVARCDWKVVAKEVVRSYGLLLGE